MGFFSRLKTGWHLAKDSVGVLRSEPSLVLFPLISGIAGALFIALVLGGSYVFTGFESDVLTYATLFVLYLGLTFTASFFNAAVVYNAREVFAGRDPTLRQGMAAAWRHKGTLFVWSVIAATVGVILRAIESQDNAVARIAAMLFSVAWGILTYFIIPVIVFEDVGLRGMFTRSGKTFKDTWGETAGAGFGVGLITAGLTVLGLLAAGGVYLVLGGTAVGAAVAIGFAVLVVLVMVLVGTTLGAIAKTALYVYATEGKTPAQFSDVDLSHTAE